MFEVSELYRAPNPQEFFFCGGTFSVMHGARKSSWHQPWSIGLSRLYLGGNFKEESKSVMITQGSVTDVSDLEFNQQELTPE